MRRSMRRKADGLLGGGSGNQLHNKPKGSKDPNNKVSGPKYYDTIGIWALKPHYLGPWTLREGFLYIGGRF